MNRPRLETMLRETREYIHTLWLIQVCGALTATFCLAVGYYCIAYGGGLLDWIVAAINVSMAGANAFNFTRNLESEMQAREQVNRLRWLLERA